MPTVIITKRLHIRELETSDAAFILELLNSPGFLEFIGDRNIRTLEEAEQYIVNGPQKSYSKNGFGMWIFLLKETEQPIGICGLIKRDGLDDVDIGFAMLPQFERKGFAVEAAEAVMNIARTTYGLERIVAITKENNTRSIGLLEKLGMEFEQFIYMPDTREKVALFGHDDLRTVGENN